MSLLGPSAADIAAFKKRLISNPVISDVLSYLRRSNEEYAVAVFANHIYLHSLGYFHRGEYVDGYREIPGFACEHAFVFTNYGMANIDIKAYQKAVAEVLCAEMRRFYRTSLQVRGYCNYQKYDNFERRYTDYAGRFATWDTLQKSITCYTVDSVSPNPHKALKNQNLKKW